MLDIIVVLIIAFGFYAGFSRGLAKTIFDTLSLIIAILAAMKLSPIVIGILDNSLNTSDTVNYLLGVVITFLIVMFIVRLIGQGVEKVFKAANINFINKIAGGALQGLFFAFVLSMILWVMGNYNVIKQETKDNSVTYPYLEPLPEAGRSLFEAAKPTFQKFWDETVDAMDAIGGKAEEQLQEDNE